MTCFCQLSICSPEIFVFYLLDSYSLATPSNCVRPSDLKLLKVFRAEAACLASLSLSLSLLVVPIWRREEEREIERVKPVPVICQEESDPEVLSHLGGGGRGETEEQPQIIINLVFNVK